MTNAAPAQPAPVVEHGFRQRGREVSRLEAFSDSMLAFAITLIVVSLEAPRSFAELVEVMRGLPVFAVCFALLIQIWYKHYVFFRRYGLNDFPTILLNMTLLFVVLFYVYPLKVLFSAALGGGSVSFAFADVPALFTIYGAGFAAVNAVFVALYAHALRQAGRLELNALERFDTRMAIVDNLLSIGVAALSIAIANLAPPRWLTMAGWVYGLLGVTGAGVGFYRGWRRERYVGQV